MKKSILLISLLLVVISSNVISQQIWSWGRNFEGQLGLGSADTTIRPAPVQIGSAANWVQIACGAAHSVAIKSDGTLWAWGNNYYGQLGDTTLVTRGYPYQIWMAGANWSQVACGDNFTIAIKSNGTIWGWGDNTHGQLGNGTTTNRKSPFQIGTDTNWAKVACGGSHTIAIKKDGTLWAWGYNARGQLGDSSMTDRKTPVKIGTSTNWSQIAGGEINTAAIKSDNTLWLWGYNRYGQNDNDTIQKISPFQIGTSTNWSKVACGSYHTLAIKSDSSLWAWGANNYGQIGDSTTTSRSIPKRIGTATNWSKISCGEDFSFGLKSDGTLWAWGHNWYGQLGNSSLTSYTYPVKTCGTIWSQFACGMFHSIGLGYIIFSPTLLSPANSASNVSANPILTWSSVTGAISYRVQISTSNTFTTLVSNTEETTTSKSLSGLAYNTIYYWRVHSKNSTDSSEWSAVWSFNTNLKAPSLISPANTSTNISVNPKLTWGSFTGATSYIIQVSTSNIFDSYTSNFMVSDTSATLDTLPNGATYYWRVCSKNGNDSSAWSNIWSFTIAINATNFHKLPFQGILTNTNDQYVTDGNYNLTFKIYTFESGGHSVWEEVQNANIKNGLFSVILGTQNPIALPFNTSYWIGITIGDGSELCPRTPLLGMIYNVGLWK
jgi:alpha-tubulin suppressor-like RCC1 family protein